MKNQHQHTHELAVIGAGMAGMAASLFAVNRGIPTIQFGSTGGLLFASGLLDLMGVHPIEHGEQWKSPFDAIAALTQSNPKHPYSRIHHTTINAAFNEILEFFEGSGFFYHSNADKNSQVITAQGTIKPSYYIPRSMWKGVQALNKKAPCLIVGFNRMKEFSSRQIAETLKSTWPKLKSIQLEFPGLENFAEVHPERMARSLETSECRKNFIHILKPFLKKQKYLGVPAILGFQGVSHILTQLEHALGVDIFEIPTPSVSVSGLRLKELFERKLPKKNIAQFLNTRVESVEAIENGGFRVQVVHRDEKKQFFVNAVLLSSGRFFSRGLVAERTTIREPLFDLPVTQANRKHWHQKDFYSMKGHAVNKAGVEVDDVFRPVGRNCKPAFNTLFAAGSILAHQDWIREKSGCGISISSAYGAIESYLKIRKFK